MNCIHTVTQGREGEKGSWCCDCGEKVLDVDTRECGDCDHYRIDLLSMSGRVGICRKHLMGVTRDMHVTFYIAKGTCWESAGNGKRTSP